MNEQLTEDVRDASELLALTLDRRVAGGAREDHARLLRRFDAEPDFRAVTRAVADGFGLIILDVVVTGLVVIPKPGSPLDGTPGKVAQKDIVDALLQVAILTAAFPRPEQLQERALPVFTLADVQAEITSLIEELRGQQGEEQDLGRSPAGWRLLDALPVTAAGGRRSRESRIKAQLERLVEERLLVHERGGGYRTTEALRVVTQHLAQHGLRREVLEHAQA